MAINCKSNIFLLDMQKIYSTIYFEVFVYNCKFQPSLNSLQEHPGWCSLSLNGELSLPMPKHSTSHSITLNNQPTKPQPTTTSHGGNFQNIRATSATRANPKSGGA